jgi:guanyl-specific ribonuclease Sa
MSYEKLFIGKGRQVPNMNVARVTIPLHKLQEIAYEKEGVMYCTFEVSKMKQPDNYGREYTVSYSKLIPEANEPAPKEKKKGGRPRKPKQEPAGEPLPF